MRQDLLEEWRPVEDFPGWIVSSEGRVINENTNRGISQRVNQQGLRMVNLYKDKRIYTRLVALVVAKAFLDSPRNEFYGSVIHLNGDREDCRAINLMWRPRWFTIRYHKMFDQEPVRTGVRVVNTKQRFPSLREACTTYGLVEQDAYNDIINSTPCFHYGWILERA